MNARPTTAYLHLTRRCTLRCSYCYADAGVHSPAEEIAACDWAFVIHDLIRLGAERIVLTGGEPLLRDDLPAILAAARARPPGCRLTVATNGQLLDATLARLLAGCADEVRISVDGPRDVHDLARGPGSFDDAIRAMRTLNRAGARVAAAVTVTERTKRHLPETIALLSRSTPVSAIYVRPVLRLGRALCGTDSTCTLEEVGATLRDALPSLAVRKASSSSGRAAGSGASGCRLGSCVMVDADGSVYPCHALAKTEYLLGDVRERSIADILESETFLDLREARETLVGQACQSIGIV